MNSRELSLSILEKLKEISTVFGKAQSQIGLTCPASCSKCCFKSDISCAPIELLPMAYHLYDSGKAEEFLLKAQKHKANHCFFLDVHDELSGKGRCGQYEHRPFICRAFGLSARHGKNETTDYSLCKTLQARVLSEENIQLNGMDIPFMDSWKKELEAIHPEFLAKEMPIHESLALILEKLLLKESYQSKI